MLRLFLTYDFSSYCPVMLWSVLDVRIDFSMYQIIILIELRSLGHTDASRKSPNGPVTLGDSKSVGQYPQYF